MAIVTMTSRACKSEISPENRQFYFEPLAEIALFIKRLFEHRKLGSYKRRRFLNNPEWLAESDKRINRTIIHDFGLRLLTKVVNGK